MELNVDNVIRGYEIAGKSLNFSAVLIKPKEIRDIINRITVTCALGKDTDLAVWVIRTNFSQVRN